MSTRRSRGNKLARPKSRKKRMISQDFDRAVAAERFNINRLLESILTSGPFDTIHADLSRALSAGHSKSIVKGLLRNVFLLEPVNRDITSTKFEVRWSTQTAKYFDFGSQNDPRRCSFNECKQTAEALASILLTEIENPRKKGLLEKCIDTALIAYELPLDYIEVPTGQDPARIHTQENIAWHWGRVAERTFKLRSFVEQVHPKYQKVFKAALGNKIQVKTYLTDRAQTGNYQTNREKRWECHPNSVHFSTRKDCWGIEHELMEQLFYFDGFPQELREQALKEEIISERKDVTRCPITLDVLSFKDFANEVLNPNHGRSQFQVGHLNPLKTVGRDKPESGHTSINTAWISSDGNRIQGDRSLSETRKLIQQIANNYKNHL